MVLLWLTGVSDQRIGGVKRPVVKNKLLVAMEEFPPAIAEMVVAKTWQSWWR